MSKSTKKEIIKIDESTFPLSSILAKPEAAKAEELVAAMLFGEQLLTEIKAKVDNVKKVVSGLKFSSVKEDLVSRGLLTEEDATPVVEVTFKPRRDKKESPAPIAVSLETGIDSGFTVDKELTSKAIFDTIVPDRYKKTVVGLDKKALEEDYDNDTLPEALRGYCSKAPVEVFKTKKIARRTKS